MPEPVSEEEAKMFGTLIQGAMEMWLEETDRDEIPEELAEKVLKKMDEVT